MFNKKLEGILSPLSKIQNDISLFIQKGTENLGKNEIKIVQLEEKRDEMKVDIKKATIVSANINKLLTED